MYRVIVCLDVEGVECSVSSELECVDELTMYLDSVVSERSLSFKSG